MPNGRWFNFINSGIICECGKYGFQFFHFDRTFNSLKAVNGMTIALPIGRPQTTLTFSVPAVLPIDTFTGMGTYLKIKSNSVFFRMTPTIPFYADILFRRNADQRSQHVR